MKKVKKSKNPKTPHCRYPIKLYHHTTQWVSFFFGSNLSKTAKLAIRNIFHKSAEFFICYHQIYFRKTTSSTLMELLVNGTKSLNITKSAIFSIFASFRTKMFSTYPMLSYQFTQIWLSTYPRTLYTYPNMLSTYPNLLWTYPKFSMPWLSSNSKNCYRQTCGKPTFPQQSGSGYGKTCQTR